MNEKTKLYVFTKTEVILIFIFMLLIAPTFFLIGFRLGIGYSYKEAGLSQYEKTSLELRSQKEENVEEAANELKEEEIINKLPDESMKRLQQKIENLDRPEATPEKIDEKNNSMQDPEKQYNSASGAAKDRFAKNNIKPSGTLSQKDEQTEGIAKKDDPFNNSIKDDPALNSDKYAGKYTIQLGSYRKLEDAEAFASGFKVRGYNPIISTTEISTGVWFRVSLETFDTINDAKNYIKQERELFTGSDYYIVKFD
ncbi:MAG: hypothetical protein A2381_02720 [Bdellovibrionales bacterium RIFOXYB1_FULL_37_110]|nr:MAG: hypothetical protein A2181_05100 [Bdellovibrionales bacterium RIFOXYA1_FULL_38_20]OFZ52611.1 MAG: hypothetical protein A2417_01055 [Bdellovibrionales bacterium RIFOXYC1_FULL_37_79]OFZ58301.1 MAG: hypothetical protein A2381_02720 [Bdellovibrionales bacterium RIFOXYB1_FULL_37_110]OFZ65280.1 MAG: hypothetical protein A2577_03995 [Bdellovibrionales bacterium RIFOXYD1_FULL_36_51]